MIHYDSFLVTLSVAIAILASYSALNLVGQLRGDDGGLRLPWIGAGSVVMGLGIWSMHFVGMLALDFPTAPGYVPGLLAASVLVAIAGSLFALLVIARGETGVRTLVGGGILLGGAISSMHYIGMASMTMPFAMTYKPATVALSVVIAIAASGSALALAYWFRAATVSREPLKALAALAMGIAIAGMHYTGMAAVHFSPGSTGHTHGLQVVASDQLGRFIAAGAFLITILMIVGTAIDRKVLQAQVLFAAELAAQAALLADQRDELAAQADALEIQAVELEAHTEELATSNGDLMIANERLEDQATIVGQALLAAEDAERRQREANDARTKFFATASHELRTPINAIGGYVDLLLMGIRGIVTEEQARDLHRMKSNQQHLLRLINDMLELAKLEAKQMPVRTEHCRLDAVLETARPMFEPQLNAKGISLSERLSPQCVDVVGDPERLQQIVINLLANSIKFTPQAGLIDISASRVASRVEVRVRDSGPGVPAARRDALFSPFAQIGESTSHEGTGLGLAISRELARAMGGELSLQPDEELSGATFILVLPHCEAPTGRAARD